MPIESPLRSVQPGPVRRFAVAVSENILSAFRSLRLNPLRSALTMSGIIVGVMAIVTIVAVLQGVKAELGKQVEGLGANLVLIVPSKLDENGQPNPAAIIGISSLTENDVQKLAQVPGVEKISPVAIVSGEVDYTGGGATKTSNPFVVGTNKAGVVMNPTPMAEGRYFEDNERFVCILASKPRQELFGTGPALGKTVRIQEHDWKVIGVLNKPNGDGSLGATMLGLNTLVYVPIATAREEIPGCQVNRIALQTDYKHPAENMIATMNATLLAEHHGKEDFGVITQKRGLALVIRILALAQQLLVLLAAISLFVAGIGIMNIMLVTVTERTREIGIRKTVGARRSDIFVQFLVESITISLLGGGIGLLLSSGVCLIITRLSLLTPVLSVQLVALALGVCTLVGMVFGVTPAVRAARLSPIDALRHE
jgi:putative ABC transport system permease protein